MRQSLGTKLYYSIGEVADLTRLQPYTLRAWEREFACLRPKRVRGKNRAYRERDIAIILLIRRLLHDERYSTRGAQQRLRNEPELIRGAALNLARLCAGDGPTVEELAADGRRASAQEPEAAGPGEPTAASPPALDDLLRSLRTELREVLDLLR